MNAMAATVLPTVTIAAVNKAYPWNCLRIASLLCGKSHRVGPQSRGVLGEIASRLTQRTAIYARRDAVLTHDDPGHVALVGEAAGDSRHARQHGQQQLFGQRRGRLRGVVADRHAVMDFGGIHGDNIACARFHHAAGTVRLLRTAFAMSLRAPIPTRIGTLPGSDYPSENNNK